MKTQILLTLEVDDEATQRVTVEPLRTVNADLLLGDINRELRVWLASNPYNLRDAEHLSLKLELVNAVSISDHVGVKIGRNLSADLNRIADDLNTLAHLCRQVG